MKHADDRSSDHGDYYVDDGLYSTMGRRGIYNQMEPISKRRSVANESKASVYFTPTDSIDQTQLQLSPIHINYIRENVDSYMGFMKPAQSTARKLFFQQRQMYSADDDAATAMTFRTLERTYSNGCANTIGDDDDISETESSIMIATENDSSNEDNCAAKLHKDYIPMNIMCKSKSKIACDSKDFYYSLENVFDTPPPQARLTNDLAIDESSDVQMSNSSASDNCMVDDENTNTDWANGKVTPEKEISNTKNGSMSIITNPSGRFLYHVDSGADVNELYPSSSLPNIKRTISALAEVHYSKDYNDTHVSLAIDPPDTQPQKSIGLEDADAHRKMAESA